MARIKHEGTGLLLEFSLDEAKNLLQSLDSLPPGERGRIGLSNLRDVLYSAVEGRLFSISEVRKETQP